jgi:hypothetical protein
MKLNYFLPIFQQIKLKNKIKKIIYSKKIINKTIFFLQNAKNYSPIANFPTHII